MNGEIKVRVQFDGAGNAPKKAAETTKAMKALDEAGGTTARTMGGAARELAGVDSAAGSLSNRLGKARASFDDLAKGADDKVLKVEEGLGKLGRAAGLIGTVVGVALTAVTALWAALSEPALNDSVSMFIRASNASSQFAASLRNAGRSAREAAGDLRDLRTQLYETAAANAEARGDGAKAQSLRRSITQIAAGERVIEQAEKVKELVKEEDQLLKTRSKIVDETVGLERMEARTRQLFGQGKVSAEQYAQAIAKLSIERAILKGQDAFAEKRLGEVRDERRTREAFVPVLADSYQLTLEPETGGGAVRASGGGRAARSAVDQRKAVEQEIHDFHLALAADLAREREKLDDDREKKRLEAIEKEKEKRLENERVLAGLELSDWAGKRERAERERLSAPLVEGASELSALGTGISVLSTRLAEGLPELERYGQALGLMADQFGAVAAANDNLLEVQQKHVLGLATGAEVQSAYADAQKKTTGAVVASIAGFARAGAERIKNERLRAGVLSVIETGLGLGALATFNYPVAAAHFAAAGVLGSVAIFGGASSGTSSGGATAQRNVMQSTAQPFQQAGPSIHIYGGFFGNGSPQENGDALWQRMQAAYGTGFGWRNAA